jgi:hypothetical protein
VTKAAGYRDSDATWYIEGRSPISFGVADSGGYGHDIPVPADYDGDGDAEPSMWDYQRPAIGTSRPRAPWLAWANFRTVSPGPC